MTVEPLDPATADPADLTAFYELRLAATRLSRPDAPDQRRFEFDRWVAAPDPHWPVLFRVVRRDGTVVGASCVSLPEEDNRDSVFHWSWVHPDQRRRGVGTELLADAVELGRAGGRQLITTEIWNGGAGAAFAERYGLAVARRETLSRWDLSTVDRGFLAATAAADHPGYRLAHWRRTVPQEWVEAFAAAQDGMDDAPKDELQLEEPAHSAERVRAVERFIDARHEQMRHTVAIHQPSGEVAGLSTVILPLEPNGRAYQENTAVVRAHRGHGLGLWMKADMALRLLAEHPEVDHIVTGNATSNEHMLRINTRLGFRPTEYAEGRQAPLDDVAKLLGG